MRILVIEDDVRLAEALREGLMLQGFTLDLVGRGREGLAALSTGLHSFDAVVLDLGLPDCDGVDLLREYRRQGGSLPVLILTARYSVTERVAGLDAGADDYLAKPFDLAELAARLRALHRRATGRASDELRHSNLLFEPRAHEVTLDGVTIALSRRESMLLQVLLENRGHFVSTERLQDRLYSWDESIGSNALAVHIHNLRRKLGQDLIETVRGLGYRIPKEKA